MATDAGRDLVRRLVTGFDVFVENQGPRVMEKLGLDPVSLQAVHPALIYARIKGYGLSGPYAEYRSFDMLAQAAGRAVLAHRRRRRPAGAARAARSATPPPAPTRRWRSSPPTCRRQRTGEGQVIEMSMHEVMTMFIRTTGMRRLGARRPAGAAGRQQARRRADRTCTPARRSARTTTCT